jgi:hypothetical protein
MSRDSLKEERKKKKRKGVVCAVGPREGERGRRRQRNRFFRHGTESNSMASLMSGFIDLGRA